MHQRPERNCRPAGSKSIASASLAGWRLRDIRRAPAEFEGALHAHRDKTSASSHACRERSAPEGRRFLLPGFVGACSLFKAGDPAVLCNAGSSFLEDGAMRPAETQDLLRQLAMDFDHLARHLEDSTEAFALHPSDAACLQRARDAALNGANLARRALGR